MSKATLMLSWRNIQQARLRSGLSVLTVALGTGMTIASDVTARSLASTLEQSEDLRTLMGGLLDQFAVIPQLAAIGVGLAAGFFIFNAFLMSLAQRRHQVGLLRTQGATRRQILMIVLLEVFLITILGCLIGILWGYWGSSWVIETISKQLGEGILVFTHTPTPFPVAIGLASLVGVVGMVAGMAPAALATRIPPLAALRQSEGADGFQIMGKRGLVIGILLIALVWVWVGFAPPGEWTLPPWDALLTVIFIALWLVALVILLPPVVEFGGRGLRRRLQGGVIARLVLDSVRRSRRRVVLAALTLAMAVTLVIGVTGLIRFMFNSLMRTNIDRAAASQAWVIAPFNFTAGMSGYSDLEEISMPTEFVEALGEAAEGRGELLVWRFIVVPELSSIADTYFSFVLDPEQATAVGDWVFDFQEGSWPEAKEFMNRSDCGLLMLPMVALRNGVSLGDTMWLNAPGGPTECVIAGIGSGYVTSTIILDDGTGPFSGVKPISGLVVPTNFGLQAELEAALLAVMERYPGAQMTTLGEMAELQTSVIDKVPMMFNALLLVTVVAATLGVVNNTVISVVERRSEFTLLRAVGAVQRQVTGLVVGEAAWVGLLGGVWGGLAGVGVVVLMVVVHGGNGWGVPDLDLWKAAGDALAPSLQNGLMGVVLAPMVSAVAAWLTIRAGRGSAS